MKNVHLVNLGTEDEPHYVACENKIVAYGVADLCMGVVEEHPVPLYEMDDPFPEIKSVHWASFRFDPAQDENGHVLTRQPGTVAIRTGTEEALDAFVTAPATVVLPGHRGWSVLATGYPSPDAAQDAARIRFTRELDIRGLRVTGPLTDVAS